jgi:hypothetical protein
MMPLAVVSWSAEEDLNNVDDFDDLDSMVRT